MAKFPNPIRRPFGCMHRKLLSSLGRSEYRLPDRGPIVTFTFDDFPRTALDTGGAILRAYGAYGTYYVAMGLKGGGSEIGEYFCTEDLKRLLADGHELGSHTFSHVSCWSNSLEVFEADVLKGREAVADIIGSSKPHLFAYPYGDVTLKAKSRIGPLMDCSRGVYAGINISPMDLHLLRAISVYDRTFDIEAIKHLFRLNLQHNGWMIFYTHDVREKPSPWGCTPGQFEAVVRLASRMEFRFLTVGDVLAEAQVARKVHEVMN